MKGCDICLLSEKKLNKSDLGEGFSEVVSNERLREEILEVLKPFTDCEGKFQRNIPSGRAYALYKRVDKSKKLIAVAIIKRVAGKREEKEGAKRFFEGTGDVFVLEHVYRLTGYEEEMAWFEEALLSDMRSAVGLGTVKEVFWGEWHVHKVDRKKFGGRMVTAGVYFVGLMALYSVVFHNLGLGLLFALMFGQSFVLITRRSAAEVTRREREALEEEFADDGK